MIRKREWWRRTRLKQKREEPAWAPPVDRFWTAHFVWFQAVNIPDGAQPGALEETSLVVVPAGDIGQSAMAVAETSVTYQLYLPVAHEP